jgi:hypothetical protein
MAETNVELVFYGQLVDGFSQDKAKQQIAELFKAGPEQIERMFTGKRIVIRNKMDLETGRKYVAAMAKRGAVCQLEIMGQPGVAVTDGTGALKESSADPGPEVPDSHGADFGTSGAESQAIGDSPDQGQASSAAQPKPEPSVSAPRLAGDRLDLAGEKADEILDGVDLKVAPVGVQLSEKAPAGPVIEPETGHLSLAPVGSDLGDKTEQPAPIVPDTTHLSLKP